MSILNTKLELKNILSVINDYDVFLFDLWGVLIDDDHAYSHVVDVVNEIIIAQKKVFFVSNTSRPSKDSFKVIKSWGINTEPEMVFTAGNIAQEIILTKIKQQNLDPVIFHLGDNKENNILRDIGLTASQDLDSANLVLLTIYRDQGDNLAEFDGIFKFVAEKNIPAICANPDLIFPKNGYVRYCAGYFASRLEGFGAKVSYAGKPYPEIYDKVLKQIPEVPKNRILMIGDTFETDIQGANDAGIHSALVLTGNAAKFHSSYETMQEKLQALASEAYKANVKPTFVTRIQ